MAGGVRDELIVPVADWSASIFEGPASPLELRLVPAEFFSVRPPHWYDQAVPMIHGRFTIAVPVDDNDWVYSDLQDMEAYVEASPADLRAALRDPDAPLEFRAVGHTKDWLGLVPVTLAPRYRQELSVWLDQLEERGLGHFVPQDQARGPGRSLGALTWRSVPGILSSPGGWLKIPEDSWTVYGYRHRMAARGPLRITVITAEGDDRNQLEWSWEEPRYDEASVERGTPWRRIYAYITADEVRAVLQQPARLWRGEPLYVFHPNIGDGHNLRDDLTDEPATAVQVLGPAANELSVWLDELADRGLGGR